MKLMKTILSTNHNRTDAAVTYFIDVSLGDLDTQPGACLHLDTGRAHHTSVSFVGATLRSNAIYFS